MLKILRTFSVSSRNCLQFSRNFSYKSDLSLDKLYPKSNMKIVTPTLPVANAESDKFNGVIPMNKLDVKYSRSSGPGGQNVNKLETKVDVRFHVATADWIPKETRERFLKEYNNQITKDGYFVVKSDTTRFQYLNLAHALERVRTIIRKLELMGVKKELSPEKKEVIRKRMEKAARERLFVKRNRSVNKEYRRGLSD